MHSIFHSAKFIERRTCLLFTNLFLSTIKMYLRCKLTILPEYTSILHNKVTCGENMGALKFINPFVK